MNKIATFFLVGGSLFGLYACAPKPTSIPPNEYGLQVVTRKGTYKQMIKTDGTQQMVALSQILTPLRTEFVYATSQNFTHEVLYKMPQAYMRLEAATALKKVQDTLLQMGYDIKIFDSYRPYSVTKKMWQIVPDDRYAANPANGSGHNRGVAVDLTLVDSQTGLELMMPTPFDSFSDTSHHDFMQLPQTVLSNRALLKNTMEQYGFVALSTEWWHYSLPQPKRFQLLNLSFKKMKQLTK